jgi:Domain of unknown function (DUF6431)
MHGVCRNLAVVLRAGWVEIAWPVVVGEAGRVRIHNGARPSPPAVNSSGGPCLTRCGAPQVLMVDADPDRVEQELGAGGLGCPCCGGGLGRWGFARPRRLRGDGGWVWLRPRRGRCRACRATHVLLPVLAPVRRVDLAQVIGRALLAKTPGAGTPPGRG